MIFAKVEGDVEVDGLREVVFTDGTGGAIRPQKKGWFHKWTFSRNLQSDMALIETEDGTMQYVPATRIRFVERYLQHLEGEMNGQDQVESI